MSEKSAAERLFPSWKKIMVSEKSPGARRRSAYLPAMTARQKTAGIVCGAPEAVIKLSSKIRDYRGVKMLLDYISRDGAVSLTDEAGNGYLNENAALPKIECWRMDQDMPAEGGLKTEALHIVLSSYGDPEKVRDAAYSFAKKAFYGHEFFMAEHTDTAHYHLHFLVKAVDREDRRIYVSLIEQFAWREAFAAELLCRGVAANATKRWTRVNFREKEDGRNGPGRARAAADVIAGMAAWADELEAGGDPALAGAVRQHYGRILEEELLKSAFPGVGLPEKQPGKSDPGRDSKKVPAAPEK